MIAGIAFAVLYAAAVVVLHALPGSDPGVLRVQALLLIFAALALAGRVSRGTASAGSRLVGSSMRGTAGSVATGGVLTSWCGHE